MDKRGWKHLKRENRGVLCFWFSFEEHHLKNNKRIIILWTIDIARNPNISLCVDKASEVGENLITALKEEEKNY